MTRQCRTRHRQDFAAESGFAEPISAGQFPPVKSHSERALVSIRVFAPSPKENWRASADLTEKLNLICVRNKNYAEVFKPVDKPMTSIRKASRPTVSPDEIAHNVQTYWGYPKLDEL